MVAIKAGYLPTVMQLAQMDLSNSCTSFCMLFDDLASLEATIGFVRADIHGNNGVQTAAGAFKDDQDPDVDRLLHGSPLPETAMTFDEMHMRLERSNRSRTVSEAEPDADKNDAPAANQPLPSIFESKTSTQNVFEKVEVYIRPPEETGLSALLSVGANDADQADANANTTLTMYFPDRSCTEVKVNDTNTVHELIKKTLAVHQAAQMEPALYYKDPECYEIRLHEGDGYPDEDFPALDRERQLKRFGDVQEYCLCQIEGVMPSSSRDKSSEAVFDSPLNRLLINIKMPKNMYVKKKLTETTTARDLLHMIARTHILRLYTDEYIFVLSAEDQVRLGLVTPVVGEEVPILSLGVQELSLQRKVYADAPKVHTSKLNATNDSEPESRPDPDSMMFKFNDVTAAVYQEWNIVKKNKFGRRQERIMGVDAHKIYNSKKEGKKAVTAVYRAHRNITTIKDIGYVADDVRAFRITFDDDGELVSVEYQAENSRLCAEIVSKIKYIMRYLHNVQI